MISSNNLIHTVGWWESRQGRTRQLGLERGQQRWRSTHHVAGGTVRETREKDGSDICKTMNYADMDAMSMKESDSKVILFLMLQSVQLCVCVHVCCKCSTVTHPLLALRALVHECKEVEVSCVRLCLPRLDQTTNVAVDPCARAGLAHVSWHRSPVPQFIWSRPQGPPLWHSIVGNGVLT